MVQKAKSSHISLEFPSNQQIQALLGPQNENLITLEKLTGTTILHKGNTFSVIAEKSNQARTTSEILKKLYQYASQGAIEPLDIMNCLNENKTYYDGYAMGIHFSHMSDKKIIPKTKRQAIYLEKLQKNTIVFALGTAGSGKTFLAIAHALKKLDLGHIRKIVLTRPAIEAGERLGFLPGSVHEKVDPYLKPFYDALFKIYPESVITKKIDNGEIEISPLAYMRGQTLDNAHIIADEGQNISHTQMKMLLTRLGQNSFLTLTGDPSQIDIPLKDSGLARAEQWLKNLKGISSITMQESDCVRHPLVKKILATYRKNEQNT